MMRATMGTLVGRVRDLAAATYDEYTVGDTVYWSDQQLQDALDRTRREIVDEAITPVRVIASSGSAEYRIYQSVGRNYESTDGGTARFYVRTADGARLGTATYSVDYALGRVEFAATTGGSVLYLSGYVYDPYAAAADVWRQKSAHVAVRFDFSADGASFKASQLRSQYDAMAARMESMATIGGGLQTGTLYRDDVTIWQTS